MTLEPAFLAMRADLVQRGLLTGDFRLTPAGHAYVEATIEQLQAGDQSDHAGNPGVRWNTQGGRTHG